MARHFKPKYRLGHRATIYVRGLPVDAIVADVRFTPGNRTYTMQPDTGPAIGGVRECDMGPAVSRTLDGGFAIDRDGAYWHANPARGWVRVTPQDCRALRWALAYHDAHDAGHAVPDAAAIADKAVPPRRKVAA